MKYTINSALYFEYLNGINNVRLYCRLYKKKYMYRSCEHVFSRTEHGGDVQAAGQLGEVCAACPPLLHTTEQCAPPAPGQLGQVCAACPPLLHTTGQCASPAPGQLGEVCAACPPLLHTTGQCALPSPGQLGNPALKLLNTDQDPQHRG